MLTITGRLLQIILVDMLFLTPIMSPNRTNYKLPNRRSFEDLKQFKHTIKSSFNSTFL